MLKIKTKIKNKIFNILNKWLESYNDKFNDNIRLVVKGAHVNHSSFHDLKNYCFGKKLVICGAGPSLKKYKPIKDAIHIALNRAIMFDKIHFDFLFVQDFNGVRTNNLENLVKNYSNCIKFFEQEGYFNSINLTCCNESFMNSCPNARPYYSDFLIKSPDKHNFSYQINFTKDIDKELLGGFPYVGLTVLQFALFLNPTDIYLVGYDCNGTHFSFTNQNKESINWEKRNIRMIENYLLEYYFYFEKFKEFAKNYYPSTKIHSINPVKLKGLFDDIFQS